ncbi:thiol:disulfide interchange protein DsbG [Acidithiobacillus sp.]|uniref:thiol:disulfide interchange protein DsbG n=1 Tax=Acidithiobacillus sp. TaxID=1872118 RepID=UPI00260D67EF|nr:thiol:disulfide interchange protein DsbG [Acidithiobacillus sp.]
MRNTKSLNLLMSGILATLSMGATADALVSPGFLQKALHASSPVKVLKTLPGPRGLTAAWVSVADHTGMVWVVGKNEAVVPGAVLNAQGQDLSQQMAIRMGITPKPMNPAAIAASVKHVDTFLVGDKGPELTAFMDPNCIFCHKFYEKALPLIHAGKLHLRVVLVGFLKPTSAAKAAAVLMAKHPAQALAFNESHFNVAAEEGGIHPAVSPLASIRQAVTRNTQLLARTGEEATPTLLYLDKQGQWKMQYGLGPHSLQKIMTSIS